MWHYVKIYNEFRDLFANDFIENAIKVKREAI